MGSADKLDGVDSVNGRTGTVALNSTDITNSLGYSPVQSVNGATGNTITAAATLVSAPASGNTVNLTPTQAVSVSVINPAGLLLALNLAIGDGFMNGQLHFVVFSKAITTLAMLGTNLAVTVALPVTVALGGTLGFVWDVVTTKWTRFM